MYSAHTYRGFVGCIGWPGPTSVIETFFTSCVLSVGSIFKADCSEGVYFSPVTGLKEFSM